MAAAGLVSLWPCLVRAGEADCADLLPGSSPPVNPLPAEQRRITALDLVRLRDVGPVYASIPTVPLLTVSPDGTRVAFQVRRADPTANSYCQGMVVVDIAKPDQARLVDVGGEFMTAPNREYGLVDIPVGCPATVTPLWSPDGQWIYYLRRDNKVIQVWRARANGGGSEQVFRRTHHARHPFASTS